MQCSQVEKRSHGSRKASSGSSSPPGPGGRVISSAGEMLLASWSSRSSGSSTCSPSSSGPCRAMSTARSGSSGALKECYRLCVELVETLSGRRDLSSGHNWRKAAAQELARASIAQRLAGARPTSRWRASRRHDVIALLRSGWVGALENAVSTASPPIQPQKQQPASDKMTHSNLI